MDVPARAKAQPSLGMRYKKGGSWNLKAPVDSVNSSCFYIKYYIAGRFLTDLPVFLIPEIREKGGKDEPANRYNQRDAPWEDAWRIFDISGGTGAKGTEGNHSMFL